MSEKQKLESILEATRLQLLAAQISFDTWLELIPTEDNDKLDILNAYKGFFIPARSAFLDRCFIKLAIVTDRNHKKAPSLYRAVQQLGKVPGLVTKDDVQDLTSHLDEQRNVEKKVRRFRDKKAAHWEMGANPEPVYIGEVRGLLERLEDIFNDVYGSLFPSETYSFQLVEHGHTDYIIKGLREYHAVIGPAMKVGWTAASDADDPSRFLVPAELMIELMKAVGRLD